MKRRLRFHFADQSTNRIPFLCDLERNARHGTRQPELAHLADQCGSLESQAKGGAARSTQNPVCFAKDFQDMAGLRLTKCDGRYWFGTRGSFQIPERRIQD